MREKIVFVFISTFVLGSLLCTHVAIDRWREDVYSLDSEILLLKMELKDMDMRLSQIGKVYDLSMGFGSICFKSDFEPEVYEQIWAFMNADELKGTGKAISLAEDKYNVNGIFIAAVAYHESAGGTSGLAVKKNNLFGLNASDCAEHQAYEFASKDESIDYVGNLFNRHYLDRNGRYYCGGTPANIGMHYATDPCWSEKVCSIMRLMLYHMVSQEMVGWLIK